MLGFLYKCYSVACILDSRLWPAASCACISKYNAWYLEPSISYLMPCAAGRSLSAITPAQPLRVTTVAGIKQKFSSQLDIRYLMELNYLYVSNSEFGKLVCHKSYWCSPRVVIALSESLSTLLVSALNVEIADLILTPHQEALLCQDKRCPI